MLPDLPKALPLGELSPKVTERASSSPKSIHTAIRTGFCQSDAIAVFLFSRSSLALSGASLAKAGLRHPAFASLSLASCWPLPQQLLPVSAAGGGRRRCPQRGSLWRTGQVHTGRAKFTLSENSSALLQRAAASGQYPLSSCCESL